MQLVKMFSTLSCPYCVRAKALLKQRGVEVIEDVEPDSRAVQLEAVIGVRSEPGDARRELGVIERQIDRVEVAVDTHPHTLSR